MNIYEHQKHGTPKQTHASQPGVESEMNPRPIHLLNVAINYLSDQEQGNAEEIKNTYTSTKSAIFGFTRSMAQSLAKKNIRVNMVAPGPIWTPLIPSTMDVEMVESCGQNVPIGRPGQSAEHVGAYVLLASDEGSYPKLL